MTTILIVTASFEALHCWPQAPDEVAFLRDSHRHRFGVEVGIRVQGDDRQVEFLMFKARFQSRLREVYDGEDLGPLSCEVLCKGFIREGNAILKDMGAGAGCFVQYVKVMEDDENGAIVSQ